MPQSLFDWGKRGGMYVDVLGVGYQLHGLPVYGKANIKLI
jgi:hypothetical protein